MRRVVESELLDHLPPGDPRAVASRGDLRRLNFIMGHAGIFAQALPARTDPARPIHLVELGAGDGTLLLRLARNWARHGVRAHVTLVDRLDLLAPQTRHAFASLNWTLECVREDVFTWLEQTPTNSDAMLANLFLHHFPDDSLKDLLRLAARKTRYFIACEPRRAPLALTAARWLWLIGCNAITRHDAVVSVRAGFRDRELSTLWPEVPGWRSHERAAGLFSHCFSAKRHA
jgi:hypothetical protein